MKEDMALTTTLIQKVFADLGWSLFADGKSRELAVEGSSCGVAPPGFLLPSIGRKFTWTQLSH